MRNVLGVLAAALLAIGSISANASYIGTVPNCLDTGGTTPDTFCTSDFTVPLNNSESFNFFVRFDNASYLETLLAQDLHVDLFYTPDDFPFAEIITSSLSLVDGNGNISGIAFDPGQSFSPGILTFDSAGIVAANTLISGYSVSMTCDDSVLFTGKCDEGFEIFKSAISMDRTDSSGTEYPSAFRLGPRTGTVPVPATLALFGLALAALGWSRRARS